MKIQFPTKESYPVSDSFISNNTMTIYTVQQFGELNSIMFSSGDYQVVVDYTDFHNGIPNQFRLSFERCQELKIMMVYKNHQVQIHRVNLNAEKFTELLIQLDWPMAKAV